VSIVTKALFFCVTRRDVVLGVCAYFIVMCSATLTAVRCSIMLGAGEWGGGTTGSYWEVDEHGTAVLTWLTGAPGEHVVIITCHFFTSWQNMLSLGIMHSAHTDVFMWLCSFLLYCHFFVS